MPELFLHDTYVTQVGHWGFVALAFALGGTLGSFLNVVAYRLPQHMSLSWPGSHCPACGKPIRWHDNVPIFGWLRLGGKCRDCGASISPRYPTVEALVAAASALLAWSELFVPILPPDPAVESAFALNLGPYAFHLLLLCTLMAAALIEFDAHRPPPRLFSLPITLGLAIGAMWPLLRWDALFGASHLQGVADGVLGGLAAMALAALAWPGWVGRGERWQVVGALTGAAELILVGVFLGTREVAIAAALAMALFAIGRLVGRIWPPLARSIWAGCLWVATLATVVVLRTSLWIESETTRYDAMTTLLCAAVVVMLAALFARFAGPSSSTPPS